MHLLITKFEIFFKNNLKNMFLIEWFNELGIVKMHFFLTLFSLKLSLSIRYEVNTNKVICHIFTDLLIPDNLL